MTQLDGAVPATEKETGAIAKSEEEKRTHWHRWTTRA